MTPTQFRSALASLGLSQMELSRLFKVSDRTVRNWADRGVDYGPVVILLQLLGDGTLVVGDFPQ